MFNWKNWQKSLASMVLLIGVSVLTFGDFSVSKGTAPEIDTQDLYEDYIDSIQEAESEEKSLLSYTDSEFPVVTSEYREQVEFELSEQERLEKERIAEEKRLEEERLAEEKRLEEERIAEEVRVAEEKRKAEEKKEQERLEQERLAQQKVESATNNGVTEVKTDEGEIKQETKTEGVASTSGEGQSQQQATPQPKAEPKPQRTDGFNFKGHHFPLSTFSGNGQVPLETPYVFQWSSKPTHYLVERVSPAGRVIQQLGMGDTVVLNGKSYVVTHIKRTVPNDTNALAVLNSVSADMTIQTCETTRGADGYADLTLWYLHAK